MNDDQKFDFSKAIKELEEINHWFQSEDIDLDEGLAKFRRGLALIKQCKMRIKRVENEFTEIKREFESTDDKIVDSEEPQEIEEVHS